MKEKVQRVIMDFWRENQGNRLSSHMIEGLILKINDVFAEKEVEKKQEG